MIVERIAFRFQTDELQVLMKLLEIELLPGIEIDPNVDEEAALHGLIDDEIVQPAGAETMMVDRAVSLILKNAAAYESCIIVDAESARMILFKGKLFDVILRKDEGSSILCPIKERDQASRQFLQETARLQAVRFAIAEKGAELNWEDVPPEGLAKILEQKLSLYIG